MASIKAVQKLEKLLERLPFHLDDIEKANRYYERWQQTENREDRKIIDLWTYCFVWRGLLLKFSSHSKANDSDFDMVVAEVYERVVDRRHTLREKSKYASWVSVICRNVFINYSYQVRRGNPGEILWRQLQGVSGRSAHTASVCSLIVTNNKISGRTWHFLKG